MKVFLCSLALAVFVLCHHSCRVLAYSSIKVDNLSSFITDYVKNSEYPHAGFYTVVVCTSKGTLVDLARALSTSQSKLYVMRTREDNNMTEWNVSSHPQGFLLDMLCPHANQLLSQASDLNLFRRPYSWLLLDFKNSNDEIGADETLLDVKETTDDDPFDNNDELENTTTTDPRTHLQGRGVVSLLSALNVRLDSLVMVAELSAHNDRALLTEFYKIRANMPMMSTKWAEWSQSNGFDLVSSQVLVWRRRNLHGIIVSATIVINHDESLDHLDDMVNKHHDSASRLSYSIVTSMADIFNVSITLVKTDTWGTFQNGEWNGMVADLVSNKAEVGCCPLFLTAQRMQVVDYLQGTSQARTAFIATAPPLSYSSNLFALPFSGSVWAASLALIFVTSLLLYITTSLEESEVRERDTLHADWSDIAMLNLGAICQQGCDAEPKGPSGRVVTLILYLAVMFLYVSYSASIVALLQSSDTSIRTIKDLLHSPLQCGAENIPYQRVWFKAASDPIRKEFYQKKIAPKGDEHGNFLAIEEGIRKVRQGLYAFHVEVSPGYQVVQQTFTETEKCGLQELPSFIQVPEPWIPMQKNSPFAEFFKIGIKVAREVGIESRSTGRLYTKKPPCSAPGSNFVSVGLMDVHHLFLILAYGLVSSIVLVLIERLVKLRLQNKLEKMKYWAQRSIAELGGHRKNDGDLHVDEEIPSPTPF